MSICDGGPQEDPQIQLFAKTHRIQHIVVQIAEIYCSERIQTTGSKGKRRGDCARGKQWELAEAFPPGVARDMLTRPSKGL